MLRNQKEIYKKGKYKKQLSLTAVFCISLFLPLILFAQIEITEVMYDPGEDTFGSKADGGREWIEIHNLGSDSVNLDGWKLFDNKDGGGHPLSSVIQGSFTMKSGEYLIIADVDDEDDSSTFLTDYPNFSGTVINSNFGSFNNTAGVFAVDEKDTDVLNISWVEYSSDQGANGDGNSLQKVGGVWIVSTPTPGEANLADFQPIVESDPEDPPDETPPPVTTSTSSSPPTVTYKIEPQIFTQINPLIDTPIAGADFPFGASSYGLLKEPLQNEKYIWSFGDGARKEGQNVLHAFQYPGDYVITLEVVSGKNTATDRIKIKAISSGIFIADVSEDVTDSFIEISNPSKYELNLSWWRLRVDNNFWMFPKNTIMLPNNQLKLSSRVTSLFPRGNSIIQLLYPNGSVAFEYVREIIPVSQSSSVVQKTQVVPVVQAQISNKTQTASIQDAVQKPSVNPSVEVGPPQIGDLSLLSTSSQQTSEPESEESNDIFNKWTMSLAGVISLAFLGVTFATKLDK